MLLLGPDALLGGRLADGLSETLSGQTVSGRQEPVVDGLPGQRHDAMRWRSAKLVFDSRLKTIVHSLTLSFSLCLTHTCTGHSLTTSVSFTVPLLSAKAVEEPVTSV